MRTATALLSTLTLLLGATTWLGCPEEKAAESKAPSSPGKTAGAATPAEKPAPEKEGGSPKAAAPAQPAAMVPPGVEHLRNPDHKDMPTPKDMPELDTKAAEGVWAEVKKDYDAALAEACKADPKSVVRLAKDGTRIGYVSYKNEKLPVSGYFAEAYGFGVFGKSPTARLVINPLSLDSGDPVRDRKLEKLFFELGKGENARFVFEASKIDGALPTEAGQKTKVTLSGTLTLHGTKHPLTLPFEVNKAADGYVARLATDPFLLGFADFGLIEPLKALMKSCNHAAMGTSAKLDLTLRLVPGCS
ncbi:MAG: YceI family protein [Deltaproteobacteria bacterium]|nr:MAG: YceI family protein [Deltaproteobacteria bacterium]